MLPVFRKSLKLLLFGNTFSLKDIPQCASRCSLTSHTDDVSTRVSSLDTKGHVTSCLTDEQQITRRTFLVSEEMSEPNYPRVQLHRSDVQQLLEIKAEDLDQEDPEPLHIKEEKEDLHIKEEKEDLWTRLEGEQLNVLEEADITKFLFTAVTVKSEDDKPQTSRLHQSQTEDDREAEPPAGKSETTIKTETDGEDCGGSGPARNLNPHRHSNADDEKASESSETEVRYVDWQEPLSDSGPESEDRDNVWKETRAPESAAHALKYKEALVSHVGCNTGNKANDSRPRVVMKEKPFSCDVCEKRFTTQGSLKRHMRVHTGDI